MTTATPPAPYSTLEGALASGFAITQLHHSPGHDHLTRLVTVEAWTNEQAFWVDPESKTSGVGLYRWKATGGADPTPVRDENAGVIIIDLFRVLRPLVGPVSSFNVRNGLAFNRQPGCISTTVLRGIGTGAIATYARWRSVDDFAAAFSKLTGRNAADADEVNLEAGRMTFGLIRPDYHSYKLIGFGGDV
ncbi:MAG: hypothetical protein O9256_03010 [Rhizobiaceae bacterium]|nr:hypothetical protein [Rhizobiaceae bacterium]MCZ8352889.1 hypothetical protein [Rhizobium sp.]